MKNSLKNNITQLAKQIEGLDITGALKLLANEFQGMVTFSTSFSVEDQVISHIIFDKLIPIEIFTLDTGRLFPETYSVWSRTNERYQKQIKAYYPNQLFIENYVQKKGPNAFYDSVENRKECCFIRKVEPLRRALYGNSVWVTGLRAEHSPSRSDLLPLEWDEANHLIKFHPLLNWTTEEVEAFIRQQNIPYNPLHDRGFVSIGCAPCTRAIKPGEDFRAGRWWWEDNAGKECGLHIKMAV